MTRLWRCLSFGAYCLLGLSGCHTSVPPTQATTAELEKTERVRRAQELFDLGMAFSRGGDSVRAEHYLNASIQAGYPEKKAFPELISVCVGAGRLRSALNYAEPQLRLRPSDVGLRYLVGSLYLGLRQTAAALRELETVLTIAPNEGRAHYLLGITLAEELHDEAQARAHFTRYLELETNGRYSPEVRLWLRQHPAEASTAEAQAGPVTLPVQAGTVTLPGESGTVTLPGESGTVTLPGESGTALPVAASAGAPPIGQQP
jgi:tetratricopeptide (TPR) repeat protein